MEWWRWPSWLQSSKAWTLASVLYWILLCPSSLMNMHVLLASNSPVFAVQGKIPAEKAMAPHSSILAWKIPWTEEPGRLQSMGSHRVGHNWSDLAAAAAEKSLMLWERSLVCSLLAASNNKSFLLPIFSQRGWDYWLDSHQEANPVLGEQCEARSPPVTPI